MGDVAICRSLGAKIFGVDVGPFECYSWRSASIGCTPAARRAGTQVATTTTANSNPTPADNVTSAPVQQRSGWHSSSRNGWVRPSDDEGVVLPVPTIECTNLTEMLGHRSCGKPRQALSISR